MIVVYAKNKHEFLAKEFGIEEIPSKAIFARVMSSFSGKEIGGAVLDILRMRFGAMGEVIAVDGKAIRSTAKPGNPHSALQILSAYVTESGAVLAQEAIHEKTNEIPAFQEMLTCLNAAGKMVTADAMHCQRETGRPFWRTSACILKTQTKKSWRLSRRRRRMRGVLKRESAALLNPQLLCSILRFL